MKKKGNKREKSDSDTEANNDQHLRERLKKNKLRNEALLKIIKHFNPNDHTKSSP